VQGFLSLPPGSAPASLSVRCRGGDAKDLESTLVFSMRCPRDVSVLEYRLATDEAWTEVAIPPTADPALVGIALWR
jgi:hypothetical protein